MNLTPAIFLLASLAYSQPTNERFIVSGAVINAITNEPVHRANVSLRSATVNAEGSTRTGPDGSFAFAGIEAGAYFLSAGREGFISEPPMRMLSVGPHVTSENLVVKLLPNAAISGKVLDENVEPISAANVTVMRRAIVNGRRQIQVMGSWSTDDGGQYRITNLPGGDYYVRAVSTRTPFSTSAIAAWGHPGILHTYAPTFYPGTHDFASAVPGHLSAGQEVIANFDLKSEPAYRLKGRILNAPAALGFSVSFSPAGTPPSYGFPVSIDAKTSKFAVYGVPAGTYLMTVQSTDANGITYSGRKEFSIVDSDLEGQELSLMPASTVTGAVHLDSPVTGAILGMNVQLVSRDPQMGGYSAPASIDVPFSMKNVPAGTYDVGVYCPPTLYVKSISAGGVDVQQSGLTAGNEGSVGPLEIWLSDGAASASGIVLAGEKPATNAFVVFLRDGITEPNPKTALSDATGMFRVAGLAPGKYRAYAFEGGNPVGYADPELMRIYQSYASTFSVDAKGRASLELRVIPRESQ